MATKHPYAPSEGLKRTVAQLRSSFPTAVTSDTLKRLGIAPKNERYVINVLTFLDIIDKDGNGTGKAKEAFLLHEDGPFQGQFGKLVQAAYAELFDLHGESAWEQKRDSLIQFFRSNDETSDVVGTRQAATFSVLAQLAGHGPVGTPATSASTKTSQRTKNTTKRPKVAADATTPPANQPAKSRVGLTVRIEINLPANGSQETYDHIFKSIRENFVDG